MGVFALIVQADTFALVELFEAQLALLFFFSDCGACGIDLALHRLDGLVSDGLVLLALAFFFDGVDFFLNQSLLLLELLSVLIAESIKLLDLT